MGKWGGDEMSVVGGLQSLGQISRGAAKAISAARSRSSTQQLDPGHSERFSPSSSNPSLTRLSSRCSSSSVERTLLFMSAPTV